MSEPALTPRELLAAINANAIEVEAVANITGPAPVYISSIAADGTPIVTAADADAASVSIASHVIVSSIAIGERGWAFKRTRVENFDTHLGVVGDPVYLSATPGTFTLTRPTAAGALVQVVGRITVVSATVGEFYADLSSSPDAGVVQEQVRAQVVAGAGANSNIAITGILTTDKLVCVARLDRDATAANINLLDDTANCSITSNGNIQSTTNTTGDALLVIWARRT